MFKSIKTFFASVNEIKVILSEMNQKGVKVKDATLTGKVDPHTIAEMQKVVDLKP